jgi:magnesium transporter
MVGYMINIYLQGKNYQFRETKPDNTSLTQAIWIDLLNPSEEEKQEVENALGINIPTQAEMCEIELSSRLYRDNDNLFMTALALAYSDSSKPKLAPITIILTPQQLITIRYIEPQSFNLFLSRLEKIKLTQPVDLLIELLDVTVGRLADILERVGHQLDEISEIILRPKTLDKSTKKLNYRQFLYQIGIHGDLNTKARESLITFNRSISFFEQMKGENLHKELQQPRLFTLTKDIESLSSHADFLATKINFMLDAILGMVNIEQNNTIRIISVVAVIFLPPTLIATIYGMNFKFMPELSWYLGYPLALASMVLAAWLPYKYFKRHKWL